MVAKSVSWHHIAMNQRNHLWYLLGFSSRVRSATTAIFGGPKHITPGQNAAVVHRLTLSCSYFDRREKCLPLLKPTATVVAAAEM